MGFFGIFRWRSHRKMPKKPSSSLPASEASGEGFTQVNARIYRRPKMQKSSPSPFSRERSEREKGHVQYGIWIKIVHFIFYSLLRVYIKLT